MWTSFYAHPYFLLLLMEISWIHEFWVICLIVHLQCVYSINHVICPKKVQIMAYSTTRYFSFRVAVLRCYPVLTTPVWRLSWFEMAYMFCTRIWLFTAWLYDVVFLSSSFEHKEICIMSWLILLQPKQMSGFLLLLNQLICKFNILVRDILEEIFPSVADRIFSIIPREGLPSGLDAATEVWNF